MNEAKTQAHINLFAILGSLHYLSKYDAHCLALMPAKPLVVKFVIRKGPHLLLRFSPAGVETLNSDSIKAHIVLYFGSYTHFNLMMNGKAMPLILKGFTKLGFLLKGFKHITDRLAYFLKPEGSISEQSALFQQVNTELTLYVALAAAVQIGNHDTKVAQTVNGMPDGVMLLSVFNGSVYNVTVKQHKLNVQPGTVAHYHAKMEFNELADAQRLFSGEVDSFTAIATETLRLNGFLPLLDGLDKLLYRANFYLNKDSDEN